MSFICNNSDCSAPDNKKNKSYPSAMECIFNNFIFIFTKKLQTFMKAKTYKSTNNFTTPQSLSDFGIEVSNGKETKYLGLEEFNFCQTLLHFKFQKKKHVAYIPCFSSKIQSNVDKLELFYLESKGVTYHYATLYGVEQINNNQVSQIRKDLLDAGLVNLVENSQDFYLNYGDLFNTALKIWKHYFRSNTIVANRGIDRFVVNVFYDKIEFHKPKNKKNWANLKRASVLYN